MAWAHRVGAFRDHDSFFRSSWNVKGCQTQQIRRSDWGVILLLLQKCSLSIKEILFLLKKYRKRVLRTLLSTVHQYFFFFAALKTYPKRVRQRNTFFTITIVSDARCRGKMVFAPPSGCQLVPILFISWDPTGHCQWGSGQLSSLDGSIMMVS